MPSICNLRSTNPWVNVIRDSRVFDDGLLPIFDFEISNRRICTWTGYLKKDISKNSNKVNDIEKKKKKENKEELAKDRTWKVDGAFDSKCL